VKAARSAGVFARRPAFTPEVDRCGARRSERPACTPAVDRAAGRGTERSAFRIGPDGPPVLSMERLAFNRAIGRASPRHSERVVFSGESQVAR
jgi:hypothetical protein